MKILYVHQLFSTRQGAVGTRSYELAMRMIEKGHEVTMLCANYANAKTGLEKPFNKGFRTGIVDGIRIIEYEIPIGNKMSLLKRTSAFLKFVWRSLRPVLKEDYDLIFATSTPLTVAVNGIVAKIFRRKKFVFEVRDLWPELPKAMGVIRNPLILAAMSALEWSAYRTADGCVGLSPGIVDGIKKRAQADKSILLAPNACDFEVFGKIDVKPAKIPNVGEDKFIAIFSGTHGVANGLKNLLDCAECLKKAKHEISSEIRLLFIGDGKQKESLLANAKERGLDNCIFLDPVPKAELLSYFKASNVGIMALANFEAFYYGTSPNKFFDYLASSLPVVCNYPGWVSDLIIEYDCGVAVEPENPEKLSNALIALASDKCQLEEMASNTAKLANEKFNRDLIADKLISFLEKIEGK